MHVYIHTYTHTHTRINIHTYIHQYMHTFIDKVTRETLAPGAKAGAGGIPLKAHNMKPIACKYSKRCDRVCVRVVYMWEFVRR